MARKQRRRGPERRAGEASEYAVPIIVLIVLAYLVAAIIRGGPG